MNIITPTYPSLRSKPLHQLPATPAAIGIALAAWRKKNPFVVEKQHKKHTQCYSKIPTHLNFGCREGFLWVPASNHLNIFQSDTLTKWYYCDLWLFRISWDKHPDPINLSGKPMGFCMLQGGFKKNTTHRQIGNPRWENFLQIATYVYLDFMCVCVSSNCSLSFFTSLDLWLGVVIAKRKNNPHQMLNPMMASKRSKTST